MNDVGMIGCGVMGQNLALNIESRGYSVAMFDTDAAKLREYLQGKASGKKIMGCFSPEEFLASLSKPRRVLMMVPAGEPVERCVDALLPLLEKGDILMDGGNSHYADTERRVKRAGQRGIGYIGTGVSGGEEGALRGPALMPGGAVEAWPHVEPLFNAIVAKTQEGVPCCEWVGEGGAGHFVKMVHNGIEYGDMQLICEAYHLMRDGMGLGNAEMRDVFALWNRGELDSYLIAITRDILGFVHASGEAVIDSILDTAGQKGTGKWTAIEALQLGQPLTLIGEAVFARYLSALKEERVAASKLFSGPRVDFQGDRAAAIEDLRQALYLSKIVSYAQGFQLMRAAAKCHGWNLNCGGVAAIWRGGCIIRSVFLNRIRDAFVERPDLANLMTAPFFKEAIEQGQPGWRRTVGLGAEMGIPLPGMAAALAYFDAYRCVRLPANLLQAQRDYFGAHTYERVDRPRGEFFHTRWIASE